MRTFFYLALLVFNFPSNGHAQSDSTRSVQSIGFTLLNQYAYRYIKSAAEPVMMACRDKQENGFYSVSPRVEYSRRITDKISWMAGLQYQRYGFEIRETYDEGFQDGCWYGICDIHGYLNHAEGYADPRFTFKVYDSDLQYATNHRIHFKVRYDYLQFPLACRVHLGTKRIQFEAYAGPAPGFFIHNATIAEDEEPSAFELIDYRPAAKQPKTQPYLYRAFNIDALAGIGASCMLNEKWSVFFDAEGAWQLFSNIQHCVFTENYFRAGSAMGVRMNM
jgi:hypothetical protein